MGKSRHTIIWFWSLEKPGNMHRSHSFRWSTLVPEPLFTVSNDLTNLQTPSKNLSSKKSPWNCIINGYKGVLNSPAGSSITVETISCSETFEDILQSSPQG